jgi:hypothetical protein
MGYDGDPHLDLFSASNGKQRVGPARGNAGKLVAQVTRDLVGKNHRGAIPPVKHNAAKRAGFDTISATRAPVQKEELSNRPGWPQPVASGRRFGFLRWCVALFDELPRSLGQRKDGFLEKASPAVFWVRCHALVLTYMTPSARSL